MDIDRKWKELSEHEPLFNAWHIVGHVGSGSFGQVYEIEREEFGRVYRSVLKVISIPQNEDDIKLRRIEGTDVSTYYDDLVKSIVEENAIMFELRGHTNIVSYEDHTVIPHDDGIGYDVLIRMEKLTSLIDYFLDREMTEKDVTKLGIDLCQALILCQRKNILHRDIKPANIFVSDTGDFKLGDFGIARTIEKSTTELSKKGTFTYMAPEVYLGRSYGSQADIYSLGIVMYHLLNNNRAPFLPPPPQPITAKMKEEALQRRLFGEPLPAPANASPGMDRIVQKACAFKPEDRYSTAAEMQQDLWNLKSGEQPAITRNDAATQTDWMERTELLGEDWSTGTDTGIWKGSAPERSGSFGRSGSCEGSLRERGMNDTVLLNDADDAWPAFAADSGGRGAGSQNMKTIIVVAAVVVAFGIVGFLLFGWLRGGAEDAGQEQPPTSGLAVSELRQWKSPDANYSKIDDQTEELEDETDLTFKDDGVDVLLAIENNGTVPLKALRFHMYINGKKARNYAVDKDDEKNRTVFTAYGYIEPGEQGYMYSNARIKNSYYDDHGGSLHKDDVELLEVPAGGSGYVDGDPDYKLQKGKIGKYDERKDSYRFRLKGKSDRKIHKGAYIVAVYDDPDETLENHWAGGQITKEVKKGHEYEQDNGFYNPGLDDNDQEDYDVFVIDPEALLQ